MHNKPCDLQLHFVETQLPFLVQLHAVTFNKAAGAMSTNVPMGSKSPSPSICHPYSVGGKVIELNKLQS
jgi:hypothetical protein